MSRIRLIIRIVLGLLVVAIIATLAIFLSNKNKEVESLGELIAELQEEIAMYEEAPDAYWMIAERSPGQLVAEADFVPVKILGDVDVSNLVTDLTPYKDYRYITVLKAGNVLTKDLLFKTKLNNTDRYYDVYVDVMQIDTKAGDFITLDFVDPSGGPHTIFGKKLVEKIYGNMLKITLSAEEFALLQSSYVDLYLTPGASIQALTYVQASMQKASTPFYAPSEEVLRVMDLDPNIGAKILDHITERNRNILIANSVRGIEEVEAIVEGRAKYLQSLLKGRGVVSEDGSKNASSEDDDYVGEGQDGLEGSEILPGIEMNNNYENSDKIEQSVEGVW